MIDTDQVIFELGEAGEVPRHIHSGLEIFYLLKGAVNYEKDGGFSRMEADDIVVSNSGLVHAFSGQGANIAFRVYISDSYLESECGTAELHLACDSRQDPDRDNLTYYELKRAVVQLILAHNKNNPWKTLETKTGLLRVLSHLITHFQADKPPNEVAGEDSRIKAVKKYIQANFKSDLSLKDIAFKQSLSVHYLSRLFKKQTGTGFYNYLNRVRLNSAVMDLLHTREPILKIALKNGFSNVSGFNRIFMDLYGEAPARYRAARRIESSASPRGLELVKAKGEGGDLIKYLRSYDLKSSAGGDKRTEKNLDMAATPSGHFKALPKLIKVGPLGELLKAETQRQLRLLKQELVFDFIHARFLSNDGLYSYKSSIYADYEYFQAFDFIVSNGMKLILEIDLSMASEGPAGEKMVESLGARLHSFMAKARERYGRKVLAEWRVEFNFDLGCWQTPDFAYARLREALADAGGGPQAGLRFIDSGGALPEKAGLFLSFLARCRKNGRLPDFITYCMRHSMGHELMKDGDYARYRHYNANRINDFCRLAAPEGLAGKDIILLEWNTLSGFRAAESNTFFRSALFLDEMLELSRFSGGLAIWLNTYGHEAATGKDSFDAPALFLLDVLKRPIYFTAQLLDMPSGWLLYQDDTMLAAQNQAGEYIILIYNPSYFNPEYASDRVFAETQSQLFSLTLLNLHGEFTFEKYHLDQEHSAIYDRWAKMGFPSLLDHKVVGQLKKSVNTDYSVFEEKLEGSHTVQVRLKFNEMLVFKIRKKVN